MSRKAKLVFGNDRALLAVIGKSWVDARDANGNRRIEDPDDFVRIQIASGLSQGKRVIPVLVGEAQSVRPAPAKKERFGVEFCGHQASCN